jgi:pimeloyl-ACP methyl ester carboxylesterase
MGQGGAVQHAYGSGRVPARDSAADSPFSERSNNIVHWSVFDKGGHFAAMEQPELLVADVREFFRRFR